MKKNQLGFGIIEVILFLVLIGLLGFISWHFWNIEKNQKSTTAFSSRTDNQNSKPTNSTQTQYGTITGNASYPSSGLPSDEKVCAVTSTDSSKVFCDDIGSRQPSNNCTDSNCVPPSPVLKYSIKVPTGDYYVYATAEKEMPNYKAYYDEYSKCGNSAGCPATGHKHYINVIVGANAAIENADPGDWYAN